MKTIWLFFLGALLLIFLCVWIQGLSWGAEMREITTIIVHHSASDFGTVDDIDRWHKEQGWDCIGYHFVIYQDGSVHNGRDISKIGAHAKGRNKDSIGICLIGNDEFSYEQRVALHDLCEKLAEEFSIASIQRHHEECPGQGINVEVLQEEIFAGL